MTAVAVKCGIPRESVLREASAIYTKENAFFSKVVVDKLNIKFDEALICCKSFHTRMVFMYYSGAFPKVDLCIIPVNIDNTNKDNWYKT